MGYERMPLPPISDIGIQIVRRTIRAEPPLLWNQALGYLLIVSASNSVSFCKYRLRKFC
jgi:hypothetical protein